jgi:hypothetical protein
MHKASMLASKPSAILVSALALVCCNSSESETQQGTPTFETKSVAGTVEPRPDGIRFYERPKLLAKLRSEGTPVPEVVYIERDPWLMVIGSDSPSFALYEDGLTIYREEDAFRSIRLEAEELQTLRASLSEAHDSKFEGRYAVALATDQPDNTLLLYRDEPVFVSVYGSLDDGEVVSRLPPSGRDVFTYIRSFRQEGSSVWLPEQLEIMIWPYEYAPEPSIVWKSHWPGLSDPNTIQRGDSYSLYLPSSELKELRAFLATRNSKGAILIDGRKWAASVRMPFPMEELWMAPNPEASEAAD